MLVLTAKGLEFHEKTMLSLHQTDEFVAGLLTEEENTELLRLLNKLKNGQMCIRDRRAVQPGAFGFMPV